MSYPPSGNQPPSFDPYGQQQPASPYGQPQQPYGQPQPGAYQQPAPGGFGAPPPAPGAYPGQAPPPYPGGDPFAQPGGFPPGPPPRHRPNKALRGLLSIGGTIGLIVVLAGVRGAFSGGGDNDLRDDKAPSNALKPSSEITKAGDLDAKELRLGDCYKEQLKVGAGEESIDTLKAIPCTQAHNAQVIAVTTMTGLRSSDAILKKCQSLELQWSKRYPAYAKRVFGPNGGQGGVSYLSPDTLGWKSSGLNKITCSVVTDGTLTAKLPTL
ncbi:hypothetical protein GCM10027589_08180 [Actinocorallia lasiicapitis]